MFKCSIFVSWLKKLRLGVPQILIEFRSPGKLLLILEIPHNFGYFTDSEIIVTVLKSFTAATVSIHVIVEVAKLNIFRDMGTGVMWSCLIGISKHVFINLL